MAISLVSNKQEKQVKPLFLKIATNLTIIGFLLGACSATFSSTEPTNFSFPSVESTYVSPYVLKSTDLPALSPDGMSLIVSDFTNIDLQSGTQNRPFGAYIPADWNKIVHQIYWSPEQNQLAVETSTSSPNFSLSNPVFLLDIKSQQISEIPRIHEVYQWSPFGKRLLGKSRQVGLSSWQVYDLDQQSFISLPSESFDIFKEKKRRRRRNIFMGQGIEYTYRRGKSD